MAWDVERVIAEHGPGLARVIASYERDWALREDLLQEVFLAIASALPRLVEPEKLRPFIFRIAHNRAVAHVAKQMRQPRAVAEFPDLAPDEIEQEHMLTAEARSARLIEAVSSLKLPYRQVITLVLEGLSHREIGEALGLSETNVGVRVSRAKHQLKAMLER